MKVSFQDTFPAIPEGAGTAEQAVASILQHSDLTQQIDRDPRLTILQSSDVDTHCRFLLMQHERKPCCLFGNILDRAPGHALELLEGKRQELLQQCGRDDSKKRKAPGSKMSIKDVGPEFIADCVELLHGSLPNRRLPRAHCFIHGGSCPVHVQPQQNEPEHPDAISLNVTGFSCTSWSSMGNQLQWLDSSSLPWAQWCSARLKRQEDWVVCECTELFDAQTFSEIVGEVYNLHTILVSPEMIGEPIRRRRMYMLLIHKSRWQFCESVQMQSAQEVFEQLFQMQVVLPVTAKFRADASELASFMEDLLRRQNMPGKSRSGKAWSYMQACSSASRISVQEHTAWLQDNVDPPFTGWVANLSQRATHMPPTPRIPALLKNSHLYIFGLSRPALPSEHFELQGWNLYGPQLGTWCRPETSYAQSAPDASASNQWQWDASTCSWIRPPLLDESCP